MIFYKYGDFLVKNPDFVFYKFLVLFMVFSLFGGGYIVYPKGAYENYDHVVIEKILIKEYRGPGPGFDAFSLIDNKNVRYESFPDKEFLVSMDLENKDDREVEVYWYYTSLLGMLIDERAVLGLKYKGEIVGDFVNRYSYIKNRQKHLFNLVSIFCVLAFGVSVYLIVSCVLRKD